MKLKLFSESQSLSSQLARLAARDCVGWARFLWERVIAVSGDQMQTKIGQFMLM